MNETAVRDLLSTMSDAFAAQDATRLLALFSSAPSATYAGSEIGETATGPVALQSLFEAIFARPSSYAFEFDDVVYDRSDDLVWLMADGRGIERQPGGEDSYFPYRVTGVLVNEGDRWRWTLLTGSEPTTDAC